MHMQDDLNQPVLHMFESKFLCDKARTVKKSCQVMSKGLYSSELCNPKSHDASLVTVKLQ